MSSSQSPVDDPDAGQRQHRKRRRPSSPEPTSRKQLSHRDYEIGWICAIHVEFAAAQALLDETHDNLASTPHDNNHYVLGRVGEFNVVIACLPAGGMGLNSAAIVSNNMKRTYTSVRLQLVVGVAGGVPTKANDVRLGDVVVGLSVVQHDFGKTVQDGQLQHTAAEHTPATIITTAITALRSRYEIYGDKIEKYLDAMLERHPRMAKYAVRAQLEDHLYESDYDHHDSKLECDSCDKSRLVVRNARPLEGPKVHFGTIASGNQVVKHAPTRDQLGLTHSALCLEMEGAALNRLDLPFLVIRGICDYSDSHKNKDWQPHAAAVAAACAKDFLSVMQPLLVLRTSGECLLNAFAGSDCS